MLRSAIVVASVGARDTLSGISTPPSAPTPAVGSPPKKANGSAARRTRSSAIRGICEFNWFLKSARRSVVLPIASERPVSTISGIRECFPCSASRRQASANLEPRHRRRAAVGMSLRCWEYIWAADT